MAVRKVVPARRSPRQDRARATVDALMSATAQLLVRDGYDRMTTKEVAERAGTSVGSLYQYFPDKEALVAALAERQTEQVVRTMAASLLPNRGKPLAVVIRGLVEALIGTYFADPQLHRRLMELEHRIPRVREARSASSEFRVEAFVRDHLVEHTDEIRPKNLDLAAFLIVRAVRAASWSAVLERPELLQRRELIDELTALAHNYLVAPFPAERESRSV